MQKFLFKFVLLVLLSFTCKHRMLGLMVTSYCVHYHFLKFKLEKHKSLSNPKLLNIYDFIKSWGRGHVSRLLILLPTVCWLWNMNIIHWIRVRRYQSIDICEIGLVLIFPERINHDLSMCICCKSPCGFDRYNFRSIKYCFFETYSFTIFVKQLNVLWRFLVERNLFVCDGYANGSWIKKKKKLNWRIL